MRALFDTNVLLDIALARKPFAQAAFAAYASIRDKGEKPLIAPHSLATFYYIIAQAHGNAKATEAVHDLIATAEVAAFDHDAALSSMELGLADFEDSMIVATALASGAEMILTRNGADFEGSPVAFETPEVFLDRSD